MPKVFITKNVVEEVDIEYPFFALIEEEDKNVYVKIDELYLWRVEIAKFCSNVKLSQSKHFNNLGSIWFEEECEESEWLSAVRILKNFTNEFKD